MQTTTTTKTAAQKRLADAWTAAEEALGQAYADLDAAAERRHQARMASHASRSAANDAEWAAAEEALGQAFADLDAAGEARHAARVACLTAAGHVLV